jgi:Flp pilus assembly protein TadD
VIAAALALSLALAADAGVEPAAPLARPPAAVEADARAAHAEGLSRLRAGHAEESLPYFQRAAAADPASAVYATDLGFALGKAGRAAEAEATLRAAIDKDPRRFYAYVNLADLLADDPSRWERPSAIIAFLDKGLAALKDDRKGRFNLLLRVANFERSVGRTAAARARLEPLLAERGEPLSPAQRKRVLDELDAVTLDERAHALEPWPAPAVGDAERRKADEAAQALAAGQAEAARAAATALVRARPTWQRARFLLGSAFEALGRVDEAARELEIAVNLAPSDAAAWRALGRLLAERGGALEADRADEALRNALALEPAWGDLRALRAQLARRREGRAAEGYAAPGAGPTERARALYEQAQDWIEVGDPTGQGRELVQKALAESPGYVAAAVTAYALEGEVSPTTVTALWDDGPALWSLVQGVRNVAGARGADRANAADALTRAWFDRAVELDVQEARWARALARAAAGEKTGALEDLVAYVAFEPRPAHLAEARALRAGVAGGEARPAPERVARIRLLEDRPDAALRALGGPCAPGLPSDRLVALGLVHEYADRRGAARVCYEQAAARAPEDVAVLSRLARLDARLDARELASAARPPLERAARHDVAAAEWALARLDASAGEESRALERVERALTLAGPSGKDADVWLPAAREARARWAAAGEAASRDARERKRRMALGGGGLAFAALALGLRRRLRGLTLARAVARHPALFPEVSRALGELRHDVLKHRAGALGLAGDVAGGAAREELARALLEPIPTSAIVADTHARLVGAARGQGALLRPLAREPALGPLAADLSLAERLVAAAPLDARRLLEIDARLRGPHADALADLLRLGPRTRLGAAELSTWIAAVEASVRTEGGAWRAPALTLAELDVDFPVESGALHAIFANLLRNAQAAAADAEDGHVIVRVERERDVTGRQLATLLVGDSAAGSLTLDAIEARESGRGLAIVRDLVRTWSGHLVIRDEPAPYRKVVGACFPL